MLLNIDLNVFTVTVTDRIWSWILL